MHKWHKLTLILMSLLAVASTTGMTACVKDGHGKVQLKIYYADSLAVPFLAIEKEFETKYPDIDVMLEGHGSLQVIRSVTELGQDVDLAAVADYQLIPLLMYQTQMPNNQGPYADWYIEFATNKIGIAYKNNSLYSSEINIQNWYQILSRPGVRIGLADPRIDSLGYRALMVTQLAQDYYKDNTIFQKLITDNFKAGFEVTTDNGKSTINVPLIVEPTQNNISLRSYNLQLLSLLESGDLDYIFEYESVAAQHGLNFLELPPAIDLSSQEYADNYQQVTVELGFQRFAAVLPKFEGAQIIYGATIPKNAQHPQEAEKFIQFLLDSDGQSILAGNYQPPLIPAKADDVTKIPVSLQQLLK